MTRRNAIIGWITLAVFFIIFIVPFIFIFLTAAKDVQESAMLEFSWPSNWHVWENFMAVIKARNYMLLLAYFNSTVITVGAITLVVVLSAMIGYIIQRRPGRTNDVVMATIMAGLMIPPAVVPTIWVLQSLGLFKTLHGMILIQVSYNLSFGVLLFRSFIATIPRDLDEAAIIDGAKPLQIFFRVILPLLKPVTVTLIVVQSVTIFNDFTNMLYYLPGRDNVTVQLTLFNFQSQFQTKMNLLFMNILLVTIPPLLVFIFFNRQIVAGMTQGSVKG